MLPFVCRCSCILLNTDAGTVTLIVLVLTLSLGISESNLLFLYRYSNPLIVLSMFFLGGNPLSDISQSPCSYTLRQILDVSTSIEDGLTGILIFHSEHCLRIVCISLTIKSSLLADKS